MKKSLVTVFFLACAFVTASSYAATGFYAQGIVGYGQSTESNASGTIKYGNTTLSGPLDSKSETGFAFGGGLGYDFSVKNTIPLKLEVAYIWRLRTSETPPNGYFEIRPTDINSLMLNAWIPVLKFSNDPNVYNHISQPYIGLGIGRYMIDYELKANNWNGISGTRKGSTSFMAFTIGIGMNYTISEHIAADLGYRYSRPFEKTGITISESGSTLSAESNAVIHEVLLGIQFKF